MASPSNLTAYILGTSFVGLSLSTFLRPETAYPRFGLPAPAPTTTTTDLPRSNTRQPIAASPAVTHPAAIQVPPSAADVTAVSPFVYAKASRDLAIGLLFIGFQHRRNTTGVTTLLGVLSLVGFLDGTIVWFFGREFKHRAWGHWIGGAVLATIAVARCA